MSLAGFFAWCGRVKIDKKVTKIGIILGIILCILGISDIFIPTESEAYMIYGVGGTIEYIKANKSNQKLPDSCIRVLDEYANKYMLEEPRDTIIIRIK